MLIFPFSPSITITTSSFALPWISTASKPENLRYGPKNPPTLLSQIIPVDGEIVKHNDFPQPGYWVTPQNGPVVIIRLFSSLSQCVVGLIESHKSFNPNPRPPVNFFFISSVTFFSLI